MRVCRWRDITARWTAQDALRQSKERFRLFVEHAPAALAMFDREMRYLHASPRFRADYGLGDRDLRGVSHYDVFPEIPERWKEAHRLGLAGEKVCEENDRFVRADGSVHWLRWEIDPWHDSDGQIGGIVIFAEDITERNAPRRPYRRAQPSCGKRSDWAAWEAGIGISGQTRSSGPSKCIASSVRSRGKAPDLRANGAFLHTRELAAPFPSQSSAPRHRRHR